MSSDESKSRKRTRTEAAGRSFGSGLALATALAALATVGAAACANAPANDATTRASERGTEARAAVPRAVRVARFDQPVEVKTAPGFPRLLFVVEQRGLVRVLSGGRKVARPFLDLRSRVNYGGEEGLLSIAFPPDYRETRRFYVYFTNRNGNIEIDEYRRSGPLRAAAGSRRVVIRIPHPTYSNHNGGQMHFLGNDLYFGTGDGGGGGDQDGNAQDRGSLLGKLLRIDPRSEGGASYSVPDTNPFPGDGGRRSPIFAVGLRNPFRWSFDLSRPDAPRITIGDVGQDAWEEIDSVSLERARGGNFGWSYFEGFEPYPGNGPRPEDPIGPIAALGHPGYCSVTGGLVVRDPALPSLEGRYLFGDFCRSRLLSLPGRPDGPSTPQVTSITIPQVTSFTERADRTVFATSLEGWLYRLSAGK